MAIGMFESFITGHWFSAPAKAIWSDFSTLQSWLDVEAALARAQAGLGVIPVEAALVIATQSRAELFDLPQLAEAIAFAQHPLVPVLHRFEELCGEPAAGFIHWGATTQNIFDTASALQMVRTHTLMAGHLDAAITALAGLALEHQATPMAGRTHGQHALPMTMGFKLAAWVDELDRDRQRLAERLAGSFPATMGGAIGTFAATGPLGPAVQALMAQQLGLLPASMPLRSSYDRASDYLSALGILAGTAQKIAHDVVFMQRTEIGEVAEAFHIGKVGSSTMAQKRNPSTALLLVSLARMLRTRTQAALETMVRMDEGDSSATNVADTLLPEIAIIATSVTETLARLAQGLVVKPQALSGNLAMTRGLIASEAVMMRLTRVMGRHDAHRLLYAAAQHSQSDGVPFIDAIRAQPPFDGGALPADLLQALDAESYVGESAALAVETVARVAPGFMGQ